MLGDAKDDSNVTLVCDDNAHKVVLCTSNDFFKSFLVEKVCLQMLRMILM